MVCARFLVLCAIASWKTIEQESAKQRCTAPLNSISQSQTGQRPCFERGHGPVILSPWDTARENRSCEQSSNVSTWTRTRPSRDPRQAMRIVDFKTSQQQKHHLSHLSSPSVRTEIFTQTLRSSTFSKSNRSPTFSRQSVKRNQTSTQIVRSLT